MHFSQLLAAVALTSTAVNGMQYANPFVKPAARALVIDNFGGMSKRQTTCPDGLTVCGSGCVDGPCCDNALGLACRSGENCVTVNNQVACCADGYTCGAVRDCESAYGTGCTPGAVNNGHLCCDAIAPMCNTLSGTPYCSGAAVSTTYIASELAQTTPATTTSTSTATVVVSAGESTTTLSMTSTETSTVLLTPAPSISTLSSTSTETSTVLLTPESSSTSPTGTVVVIPSYGLPTGTTTMSVISGSSTIAVILTQYGNTTVTGIYLPTPTQSTSTSTAFASTGLSVTSSITSTSTAFITLYPIPTYNGTYPGGGANATVTALPIPTGAISGAGSFGVNTGFALAFAMGLAAFLF